MTKETNPALALYKLGTAQALGAYGIWLEAVQRWHELQAKADTEALKVHADGARTLGAATDFQTLMTAQLSLLNGRLAQHNEFWQEWLALTAGNQHLWAEHVRKTAEEMQHGMSGATAWPDLLGAGTKFGEVAKAADAPLQQWFQMFNQATQGSMDAWRRMTAEAVQATEAATQHSPLNGRVPPKRGAHASRAST